VLETLGKDVEVTIVRVLQDVNEVVAYGNKLIHVEVSRRISHLCGKKVFDLVGRGRRNLKQCWV
jgi:hypothetical protein